MFLQELRAKTFDEAKFFSQIKRVFDLEFIFRIAKESNYFDKDRERNNFLFSE